MLSLDKILNKKAIYAITVDHRLAQLWDMGTQGWRVDFPAELAKRPDIKFSGGVAVVPGKEGSGTKTIYAITLEGHLVTLSDNGGWHLKYHPVTVGETELRFQGIPAAFHGGEALNRDAIYVITTNGRLVELM